jgi:putative ABC transport system substrate-binding protein
MRQLLLSIALAIGSGLPAAAADLVIVQSYSTPQMIQVARLVQNSCGADHLTLVLTDYAEIDLGRIVREERPAAVLALGDGAFSLARRLKQTPTIFSMALNVNEEGLQNSVGGVSMMVTPARFIKLFAALKRQKVGVIYDKKHTGAYVRRARQQAERMGIELVALPVASPREIQASLAELRRRGVDALWLLPDTTVVTAETVDSFFIFAQNNRLPVVAFSAGYLSKGALATLEVTQPDVARQICSRLSKVKADDGLPAGVVDMENGKLTMNESVAAKLRISLPGTLP